MWIGGRDQGDRCGVCSALCVCKGFRDLVKARAMKNNLQVSGLISQVGNWKMLFFELHSVRVSLCHLGKGKEPQRIASIRLAYCCISRTFSSLLLSMGEAQPIVGCHSSADRPGCVKREPRKQWRAILSKQLLHGWSPLQLLPLASLHGGPFPPQVSFGHGVHWSNRKQRRILRFG